MPAMMTEIGDYAFSHFLQRYGLKQTIVTIIHMQYDLLQAKSFLACLYQYTKYIIAKGQYCF